MNIEVLRRIFLSRHLYELAYSYLKSTNELYLFSSINLLQDSIEAFLLGIADFLNISFDQRATFDKFFVEINKKCNPYNLPFKSQILRINRIRIDSKHHGIQPARKEVERLTIIAKEFFDEVAEKILKVNYTTISLIDYINDDNIKNLLYEAKEYLEDEKFSECIINCRKAIYLKFEKWYDISDFKDEIPKGYLGALSYAPYYSRNPEYIKKNVRIPTDYIVIDHQRLEHDLITKGIDITTFWNIWRLTPSVYQDSDKQWIIKYEFELFDTENLQSQSEYVFNATVDLFYSLQVVEEQSKVRSKKGYYCELNETGINVYEKADNQSKVSAVLPNNVNVVDCIYKTQGLDNDGEYWHIIYSTDDDLIHGYIESKYIKQA